MAKRREAIIELGKTKDVAALEPLADVFRGDADPDLRELARKAGLYIRQNNPADSTAEPAATPAAEASPRTKTYVSPEDERKAKLFIDEAMHLSINNLNDRALKSLRNALKANPNLQDDHYFIGIAAEIMHVDATEAIDRLLDRQQVKQYIQATKQQEQAKRTEKHLAEVEKVSWGVVIFDIVAFFLIMGIGPVLAILIFAQSLQGLLDNIVASVGSEEALELSPEFQELTEMSSFGTESFSPVLLVIMAVSLGTGYTFALFIYYLLLHGISSLLLRGRGSLSFLVLKLTPMFNRYWLVSYFLIYIGMALAIGQGFAPILGCFGIINVIYTLYVSGMISKKVGEAYNFSFVMGFVAVFIAGLVIFGLNVAVSVALSGTAALLVSQFAAGA